jgi:ElaB/YqjD/DUF883 family membrane-anchored ribosome-binding protein
MADDSAVSREKLVQDLKAVVDDAEELLRATASQAGERVAALRERAQENLKRARAKLAQAEDVLVDRSKLAARAADEFVHENPWRAVGIAAGIGLIVGLLIGRR